uniref:Neurotransmitter-gated ion-channel transmembrane domain-containing protein n=1 Tax=Parascaris equorum TaxID=6256 RepID=A0A914RU35_PAREQ
MSELSNGSIWSCWRIKGTGPCILDLARFPMDSVSERSIYFIADWIEFSLPSIDLIVASGIILTVLFSALTLQKYAAGIWDELTVSFTFRRRYGWYILQGYIPTYLTIFISWIPFYLGPKAIPARTMAIDVWVLSGMTFVFASLIELAMIGFMSRNEGRSIVKLKHLNKKKRKSKWDTEKLDLYSRIVFPSECSMSDIGLLTTDHLQLT